MLPWLGLVLVAGGLRGCTGSTYSDRLAASLEITIDRSTVQLGDSLVMTVRNSGGDPVVPHGFSMLHPCTARLEVRGTGGDWMEVPTPSDLSCVPGISLAPWYPGEEATRVLQIRSEPSSLDWAFEADHSYRLVQVFSSASWSSDGSREEGEAVSPTFQVIR